LKCDANGYDPAIIQETEDGPRLIDGVDEPRLAEDTIKTGKTHFGAVSAQNTG